MFAHNGDVLCSQINGLMSNGAEHLGSKIVPLGRCTREVEMLRLIGQYLCDKGLK